MSDIVVISVCSDRLLRFAHFVVFPAHLMHGSALRVVNKRKKISSLEVVISPPLATVVTHFVESCEGAVKLAQREQQAQS